MMDNYYFYLILLFILNHQCFINSTHLNHPDNTTLVHNCNESFHNALLGILEAIPLDRLTIVSDNKSDESVNYCLAKRLQHSYITVIQYNVNETDIQEKLYNYLQKSIQLSGYINCIFFCTEETLEKIFIQIYIRDLIHRHVLYIIYLKSKIIMNNIIFNKNNILFITNPKNDSYYLYYNHIKNQYGNISLINWWSEKGKLYHIPTFPSITEIYKNFKGKVLQIPVVHKPPWYFLKQNNGTIQFIGGRDHKLLALLADKLNFNYHYFNPADLYPQSKNINLLENSIKLIKSGNADLLLGDITLTYERKRHVEFSFITLADSGAFITHAPSRLNEAFALLQPFQYQVWPGVILILLFSGPVLYIIIIAYPNDEKHKVSLGECVWYITNITLKQSVKNPSNKWAPRVFSIILSLAITYVIGDMYSANLTSLLAKPGREKPIHNLEQLESAVRQRDYKIFVEEKSSAYYLLQNGSGIYGRLWQLMKKQVKYTVPSVEIGVKMVKNYKNIALIAGRETLYFDLQRFGSSYFHLSEKLNTEYSAIAMQPGSPYIENINKILMKIFEAGIMDKMTEDEYKKLGTERIDDLDENDDYDSNKNTKSISQNEDLHPISLKMLQGAFYVLIIGHIFSGLILIIEYMLSKKKDGAEKIQLFTYSNQNEPYVEGTSTVNLTEDENTRKFNWKESIKQITVEPLVCLYIAAAAFGILAVQNLQLEMACRSNLKLPSSDCDDLLAGNSSGNSTTEVDVQRVVAGILPWKTAVQSALPIVIVLLVGSYSDRAKRRRPFLLLPVLGEFISMLLLLVCASYRHTWLVEYEAAAEVIIPSLMGGSSVLLMAVYAFIADITSERVRTMRIGLVHIAATAAYPAAASVSGILYATAGYTGAFAIAAGLQCAALIYSYFRLYEPREPIPGVKILNVQHAIDPFKLLIRRREGSTRLRVALLMLAFIVIIGPAFGENTIAYLYTRTKFNWDAVKFSFYFTYDVIIHLIGTTLAVTVLSRWLGLDDLILASIACASKVAASFFYAFAETELLFYFAPVVSIISGAGAIAMRSVATKLVQPSELGQIQSLFGVCEALAPIIYTTIYTQLYIRTIETLPGAFFLLGAALIAPAIPIFLIMYWLQKKDSRLTEELKKNEDIKKNSVEPEFEYTTRL